MTISKYKLNGLLAQEKDKEPKTYGFLERTHERFALNSLLGTYSCFKKDAEKDLMYKLGRELVDSLDFWIPKELSKENFRQTDEKPKIGLYAELTSKGNLSIKWCPMDYDEKGQAEDFVRFSTHRRIAQRPDNELCLIRGVDSVGFRASVDGLPFEKEGEGVLLNVCNALKLRLAQKNIEYLEQMMPTYARILSEDFDVWMINKVNFKKEKSSKKVIVFDLPHNLSMLHQFNEVNYRIGMEENLNFSPAQTEDCIGANYGKIKRRCLGKIKAEEELEQALALVNLTQSDVIRSIKRNGRISTQVASALSKKSGLKVDISMLKSWVEKMHAADQEGLKNALLGRPAFSDLATSTNAYLDNQTAQALAEVVVECDIGVGSRRMAHR